MTYKIQNANGATVLKFQSNEWQDHELTDLAEKILGRELTTSETVAECDINGN